MKRGITDIIGAYRGSTPINKIMRDITLIWEKAGGGIYLLDTYPAAVAWSLRKLSGGYAGAAIRVRRSSDDLEQDIGFDGNDLDTTSLLSFIGAGNGFVTTIYDQAGAGLNFTQTNPLRQGRIVNSGALNTKNGKPIILKSVDPDGGYISTYAPNDGVVDKGVFYIGANGGNPSIILGSKNVQDYYYAAQSGSSSTALSGNVIYSQERINGATSSYTTRDDLYTDTLNQFLLSNNTDFGFDDNSLALGYEFLTTRPFGMYSFQELIIFDNTTDHLDKETKINSYYAIY